MPALRDWTVLSLRPRGQHAALRSASARQGARLVALSCIAIEPILDAGSAGALERALAADIVVFTSPNAVRAAAALHAFTPREEQAWLAVGAGSRRALRRAGVDAEAPVRMDSNGLLAMPQLGSVAGKRVGLVTAPGGRGQIAPSLHRRGADVVRADVYRREVVAVASEAWARLAQALTRPRHALLVLTSAQALEELMRQLPPVLLGPLRQVHVVAASARLARLAGDAGFSSIATGSDPRPASLIRTAIDAFV